MSDLICILWWYGDHVFDWFHITLYWYRTTDVVRWVDSCFIHSEHTTIMGDRVLWLVTPGCSNRLLLHQGLLRRGILASDMIQSQRFGLRLRCHGYWSCPSSRDQLVLCSPNLRRNYWPSHCRSSCTDTFLVFHNSRNGSVCPLLRCHGNYWRHP